ncbi:hypothetical protein AK830_g8605 [Neonectria ditissima]|uniref:Zn(2)-C6 fungal-type domain-containing protein n=1 Tax=Neonectria ditissima TaxID=78410 RepID=A0A0P7BDX4_9HYPO|nr:hypothetical protein AK830_g8605 [Neonectria ditissima]
MATTPSSPPPNVPSKPTFACIRCAERKVKCDRQRPCSACVNHKVDCVFQPPRPPRRRHRQAKDQILTDRLRYYESLLQEKGIEPTNLPADSQTETVVPNESCLPTPSSTHSEASGTVNKTQVIHGQGRSMFVNNSLWSRVVEEFDDPEDAFEDYSNDSSYSEASDDDFSFVLSSRPKPSTRSRHPPAERIHQLWQIFIDNVDPLTKVVHVPSLRPAIQKAASNPETIPRSFEALMFAIYSAAVMSLSNDECKQRLCEPRKTLLSRYVAATKAALSRARFMGTTSLVVLQALVLYLLSVRDIHKPRAVWSLTGVAIRIAQGMGLERDGVYTGLSPFEIEMRRRIWWQLKTHDYRTADLCGLPKFRDLDMGPESTKRPTNVNDDQLYPGMPSLPVDSKTLTDAAFVTLRYDLANFAADRVAKFRQQGKDFSQWDRDMAFGDGKVSTDESLGEVEALIEMKYLRYCDPSQPLHLITMLMARASVNTIRFLTHHPRRWVSIEKTPFAERQWVWEVSVKLLEQHNMLQSNPQLKQFAWHAAYVLQWPAFIHVLDTLRANPLIPDAEKAWRFIGNTYKNSQTMVADTKKLIHVAVGSLCLKAYSARVAALQSRNMCPETTPEFILQLRQQLEAVKAKRQARDAKGSHDTVLQDRAEDSNVDPSPDAAMVLSSHTSGAPQDQSARLHPQPSTQTGSSATDSDAFWVNHGFNDSQAGSLNNVMDMDLDLMLAEDRCLEDSAFSNITWEQWDTWLAESNTMP